MAWEGSDLQQLHLKERTYLYSKWGVGRLVMLWLILNSVIMIIKQLVSVKWSMCIDTYTHRQIDRQKDKQADRQTDRYYLCGETSVILRVASLATLWTRVSGVDFHLPRPALKLFQIRVRKLFVPCFIFCKVMIQTTLHNKRGSFGSRQGQAWVHRKHLGLEVPFATPWV
jgi:hypothetical protein